MNVMTVIKFLVKFFKDHIFLVSICKMNYIIIPLYICHFMNGVLLLCFSNVTFELRGKCATSHHGAGLSNEMQPFGSTDTFYHIHCNVPI